MAVKRAAYSQGIAPVKCWRGWVALGLLYLGFGTYSRVRNVFRVFDEGFRVSDGHFQASDDDFRTFDEDFRGFDEGFRTFDEDFQVPDEDFRASDDDFRVFDGHFRVSDGDFRTSDGHFRASVDDFWLPNLGFYGALAFWGSDARVFNEARARQGWQVFFQGGASPSASPGDWDDVVAARGTLLPSTMRDLMEATKNLSGTLRLVSTGSTGSVC